MSDQKVTVFDCLPRIYLLLGEKCLFDRLLGIFMKRLSVRRKTQDAPVALEEANSESALDTLDLFSDTRRRKTKFISRVVYVLLCRDGHHCYEIVEFHLGATHRILLNGTLLNHPEILTSSIFFVPVEKS